MIQNTETATQVIGKERHDSTLWIHNDSARLLWRMSSFGWRSAYGGCALKPVVGVAIF